MLAPTAASSLTVRVPVSLAGNSGGLFAVNGVPDAVADQRLVPMLLVAATCTS